MSEILLHTQELPEETITRLAKEGVIAIRTDDLSTFRFMNTEPASIRSNDFLWATLDALVIADSVSGNRRLVNDLKILADKSKESPTTPR